MFLNSFLSIRLWMILFLLLLPVNVYAEMYMSVSGKVVEAESGDGLSGVKLVLISWTEGQVSEAVSGVNGNFILKKVPAGSYSLFGKLDEDNFLVSRKSIPVVLQKGKNVVGIKVELEQGGAVKGRVITSNNVPIPSATIDASSGRIAYTDKDGFFLLKGVTPGKVKISVIPDHMSPKLFETNSEKLKIIDIGKVVFNVGIESAIRGVIVDQSGAPISYAIIKSVSEGFPPVTSMSREDGKFVVAGLEGAKYDLIVTSLGFQTKKIMGVEVPKDYMVIKLLPEPDKTTKLLQYDDKNKRQKNNYFSMLFDFFSPREAFAKECSARCLSPFWSGVAGTFGAEFIALILPNTKGGTYGKSYCFSNANNKAGYKLNCKEIGVKVSKMISAGLGAKGVYTIGTGACCRDNLFKSSTWGGIFEVTPPGSIIGLHYAADVGNDFTHYSLGLNYSKGFWDWRGVNDYMKKIKRISFQLAERKCSWEPISFDIVDKLFGGFI